MTRFAQRHPIITAFGTLFTLAMCIAYWPVLLTTAAIAGLAWLMYAVTRHHDHHALQQTRHRQLLAAHADYEHWCLIHGDPRGTYGQYPPARVDHDRAW